MSPFTDSFIAQYEDAFTELLRLGTVASEKRIGGSESKKEDEKAKKIYTILQALSNPNLTAKQIEALEYCLIGSNESLAVPTVQLIFDPEIATTKYILRAGIGVFRLTGEDVSLLRQYMEALGYGAFTLTGLDVNFVFSVSGGPAAYSMTADYGSFGLTGQDVTLTFTPVILDLQSSLLTSFSLIQYESSFYNGTDTTDINIIGNGSSGSDTVRYASSVDATVSKQTNGGIAEGTGSIVFKLNGVTVSTYPFSPGDNLNNVTYTYTGLNANDLLKTEISEINLG